MKIEKTLITLAMLGLLAGCTGMSRFMDDSGKAPAEPVPNVSNAPLSEPPADAATGPAKPATKNNVIAAEYSANMKYTDLAQRIDRTFQSCWIGKNAEFAGYSYGGLTQDGVKQVITLNENVDGQMLGLVKVTVIPAAGQDGYAVSLETRAEGSPGEKIMKDGIRHLAAGQKVC